MPEQRKPQDNADGFSYVDNISYDARERRMPAQVTDRSKAETNDGTWAAMPTHRAEDSRIARLVTSPNIFVKVAHVSGNNIDVLHCPFCGSGAIVARSDGSIECQFCESAYTVQVQPMYAAFPGTVDGSPYMWPGRPQGDNMPGAMGPDSMDPEALAGGAPGAEDAADAAQGFAEGADPAAGGPPAGDDDSGGGNPFAKGGDDSGDDEDDKKAKVKGKDAPPFAKKSFRTATGAVVSTEDFLRHLAITTASDQMSMIKRVKASRDRMQPWRDNHAPFVPSAELRQQMQRDMTEYAERHHRG